MGQTSINKNVLTDMHIQCLVLADSLRVGKHYRLTSGPQHRSKLHHKLGKTSAHEVRWTLNCYLESRYIIIHKINFPGSDHSAASCQNSSSICNCVGVTSRDVTRCSGVLLLVLWEYIFIINQYIILRWVIPVVFCSISILQCMNII